MFFLGSPCLDCLIDFVLLGDDIWKYVGKLTEAQRSMVDDKFKWKVSVCLCCFCHLCFSFSLFLFFQAREMEKRKEGRPGEARAALRRSVRENGYVSIFETT